MFKKFNNKGFTLLELIIVITVLAILSAVAVQSFSGQGQGAKISAHASNIAQIENAADRYATDFVWKKTDLQVEIGDAHPLVTMGYLKKAPLNPWKKDKSIGGAVDLKAYSYVLDYKIVDINGKLKLNVIPRLIQVDSSGAIDAANMEATTDAEKVSAAVFVPADMDDANATAYFIEE
ncbi:MAG TPA: hypothetical protein DEP72_02125 [Clostridiales bacterium]|nr:MAG: hypothetical protein A2Y18_00315 [Clostridiales bacterium GWD2_32_19]HCC06953.1 hypothetical protein [Clostridiales bacterium]